MDSLPVWLPFVFFVIAIFYSMVGFGGGSSYLAALVLIGLSYQVVPQTALLCNLVVSIGGVWHFKKSGHLQTERILPFVVLSIPMAYLGGRIDIGRELFVVLLGGALLIAGMRMLMPGERFRMLRRLTSRQVWWVGLPIGAALGLLSGIVGIGGGIFLAPFLILSGWCNAKQAAGAASLFILVNSFAGVVGQFSKGFFVNEMIVPLLIAVILGGQIGSRIGAYRLRLVRVRQTLAVLIVAVSIRLLWGTI